MLKQLQSCGKNLQKRYVVANTPKIHQLKIDMAACKQGGLEVVEFYSKLMGLWSWLNSYTRFLSVLALVESANAMLEVRFMWLIEEEQNHQFLMGLNDVCLKGRRNPT